MSDKKIPDEMKEQMDSDTDNEENEVELDNTEHELDADNLELLDPKLIEKLQEHGHEEMLVEFDGSGKDGGGDRLRLAREWFTEENDYRADTNITPQQVYALTMLRNLDKLYPQIELEDTQSWVDGVVEDLERYVLSIDGFARRQEENVLRALFGDNGELNAQEKDSMFMRMLSNPHSDEDND